MFSLKEYEPSQSRLADWLPWAALIAPGVVLQKEKVFQKTIAFRGPDLASSSAEQMRVACAHLNNVLKRLGSGWAFFAEEQRYETMDYMDSEWAHPVAWLVDEERRGQYEQAGAHFDSSYFITFCWEAPSDTSKKVEALFIEDPNRNATTDLYDAKRDLQRFLQDVGSIIDIMRESFPAVHELDDDETITYLHSTVSTRRHPMKAPDVPMFLDALLPDQAYLGGELPVLGDQYIMTATINGFPHEGTAGLLDALNHLEVPYRWTSRFICLDKQDAEKEIKKYRRKWYSKRKGLMALLKESMSGQETHLIDTDADMNASDAETALQELATDTVAFGYYTSTITVWDADMARCREKMDRVCAVINNKGFATWIETSNSFQAWLSSLPGHVWANVRRPLINTINLAHLFPLSAIWSGDLYDENLGEKYGHTAPLMITDATGSTPFRLNLNIGDVGHTALFGPTGSGKSTKLCMLELQWLRYPKAKVVIFDKDRSARGATMGIGGAMYEPANPDRPLAFQPLADIDTVSGFQSATEWVELCLELQGMTIMPAQRVEISAALKSLAGAPRHQRTLSGLLSLVQDEMMRQALEPYADGAFAQIFNGHADEMPMSDWIMIEMGSLMEKGEAAILPALSHLFHVLEKGVFSRHGPTLLVLDEAWIFMSHPYFMKRIREWLKTLRKMDVYVIFATQELEDAVESDICSVIMSACQTKIFLPNKEASTPITRAAYQKIGVTEAEIEMLATAIPKRQYFYKSPKGRRLFEMNLQGVSLCFSGRSGDEEMRILDEIETRLSPAQWPAAMLQQRGLDWAVELLNQTTPRQVSG
ncbi:MAG: conjugal transfer protein TrbE [Gammaproteobacteria bacterium]|nr:conjugal transfer protein TrbE [Gammaproteobacteria bacterium]